MMMNICCHLQHTFIPQLAHVHLWQQDDTYILVQIIINDTTINAIIVMINLIALIMMIINLQCKHGKDHKAENGEGHDLGMINH